MRDGRRPDRRLDAGRARRPRPGRGCLRGPHVHLELREAARRPRPLRADDRPDRRRDRRWRRLPLARPALLRHRDDQRRRRRLPPDDLVEPAVADGRRHRQRHGGLCGGQHRRPARARRCWPGSATDIDLSAAAFPYMGVRQGSARRHPGPHPAGRLRRRARLRDPLSRPAWARRCGTGWWKRANSFGITPFGVEAQRVLRLEKGHIIIGQDTDGLTNPAEAGMDWALAKQKPFYVGKRAVDMQIAKGVTRRLVGFTLAEPAAPCPKECHLVIRGDDIVGRVTSAVRSPTPRPGDRSRLRAGRHGRASARASPSASTRAQMVEADGGADTLLRSREQAAGDVSMVAVTDFLAPHPARARSLPASACWALLGDAAVLARVGTARHRRRSRHRRPVALPRLGFKGRDTIAAMKRRGVVGRKRAQPRLPPARRRIVPRARVRREFCCSAPSRARMRELEELAASWRHLDDERTALISVPRRDSHAWFAVAGAAAPGHVRQALRRRSPASQRSPTSQSRRPRSHGSAPSWRGRIWTGRSIFHLWPIAPPPPTC